MKYSALVNGFEFWQQRVCFVTILYNFVVWLINKEAPEKVELQGFLVVEVLVTTMPLIAMSVLFNHKGFAVNSIGLGPPGQFEHHQTGCTHWPKADPRCDCIQACGQKGCSTQIWPCVLFLLNCDYRKFSHSLLTRNRRMTEVRLPSGYFPSHLDDLKAGPNVDPSISHGFHGSLPRRSFANTCRG